MSNPWLKKNPFMSLWLSGANKVIGSARGQAAAAVKREAGKASAAVTAAAAQQVAEFWNPALAKPSKASKATQPAAAPRKRRSSR